MPSKSMDAYDFNQQDLLIIGLDTVHPTHASPKELFEYVILLEFTVMLLSRLCRLKKKGLEHLSNSNPSVVGICANKGANSWSFAGG